MVFYGAPSKGCEACRAKRVKCDGRRPACERCERQGRSCPGYRDLGGVIFRDENSRIVRRVAKKYGNKPLAAPSASLASPPASASNTTTFDNDHDGSPALQVPVSMVSARLGPNEGVCYFHQEFCWETVPLYAGSWAGPSSTLANATGAIGLAMLSFKRRSTSLAQEAFAEYGTAMHLVNRELSNPATALSDSTLAIVVLMSFFETLTGLTSPSMDTWTNHSKGAAALITMRSPSQLKSPVGYQLFLEARGIMITISLIHRRYVPPMVPDYTRLAMESEPPAMKYVSRVFLILIELINLRASIAASNDNENDNNLLQIREKVDLISSELNRWKATLPPGWEYENFTLGGPDETIETRFGRVKPYEGRYSVYSHDTVIMGWSYYRVCRILLDEILLRTFRHAVMAGEPGALTMCQSIRQVMDQMAGDICGSVPYLLGLGSSAAELPGMMGGYFVLVPLWVAACVESDGHPLRQTAVVLFDMVAGRIGIGHAAVLMQKLAYEEGTVAWLDQVL